ncbi:MAG TPA: hypothetical protein VIG06_18410, partial [Kofleriaceae bacterium]
MAGIRFPMFLKFWVGCSILAALLIVGGVLVVRSETRQRTRTYYLEKHLKRFQEYQQSIGRAVSSVGDLIAGEPRVRQAVAGGVATGSVGVGSPQTAQAVGEQVFADISGRNGIKPDLMLLFDQQSLLWASPDSPIRADDLRELEAVSRVRQGTAFFNKVLLHQGRAIQVAGVPVMAPGEKRVVGGLILGVDLERYMNDYRDQSDEKPREGKPDLRHRLSLVRNGEIIASVFPREQWPEVAEKIKPDKLASVTVNGQKRQVVRLDKG